MGNRRRQHGHFILLTLLLIVLLASGDLYIGFQYRYAGMNENTKTDQALALAKDALIAYASGRSTTNRPGELPCPDTNNDGQSDPPCDSTGSQIIGRLPWRTLRTAELLDGSGERLWYSVSNKFKNDSPSEPLNSNTQGQLTVTGTSPADSVIAVVFAPGPALAGQSRTAPNLNNVTQYLEGENANFDVTFTTAEKSTAFNDRLIALTPSTFFPQIEMRVTREARSILKQYYADWGFYPVAYSFGGTGDCAASNQGGIARHPEKCGGGQGAFGSYVPDWFWDNSWHHVIYYAVAPACSNPSSPNCTGAGGLLSVNGDVNVRAVLVSPGTAKAGQNRPCSNIADCLEVPNSSSYPIFSKPTDANASNDRVVIVAP